MCVFVYSVFTYRICTTQIIILLFKLVKISLNSLDGSKSKITTAIFDNVVCCEYKCTDKDETERGWGVGNCTIDCVIEGWGN